MAHLAKTNSDARVLLTTFSDALANQLQPKLRVLMSSEAEAADRVLVQSLDAVALSLYEARYGTVELAATETVEDLVKEAVSVAGTRFAVAFVVSEWERVVDAWQFGNLG